MPETTDTRWDLLLKVVGLIALIVSGTWTLYKFRQDRNVDLTHQREAEKMDESAKLQELNRFIFERQASLYFDAARSAGTIATSHNKATREAAIERFYQLYFGDLVVVEDRRVELAMIEFSRCLDKDNRGCERTITVDQSGKPLLGESLRLVPASLDNLSLELAACVRSALTLDRSIDFGNLVVIEKGKEINQTSPLSRCPYDNR